MCVFFAQNILSYARSYLLMIALRYVSHTLDRIYKLKKHSLKHRCSTNLIFKNTQNSSHACSFVIRKRILFRKISIASPRQMLSIVAPSIFRFQSDRRHPLPNFFGSRSTTSMVSIARPNAASLSESFGPELSF